MSTPTTLQFKCPHCGSETLLKIEKGTEYAKLGTVECYQDGTMSPGESWDYEFYSDVMVPATYGCNGCSHRWNTLEDVKADGALHND